MPVVTIPLAPAAADGIVAVLFYPATVTERVGPAVVPAFQERLLNKEEAVQAVARPSVFI